MLKQTERLQKVLSYAGILSRRKAERAIKDGKISVNGVVIRELGFKVNPYIDQIEYLHEKVQIQTRQRTWILNKPRGVISSTHDPEGRPTVIDLVKFDIQDLIYPVGRLDFHSEGLIILTNDGELANHLAHPRYGIKKKYQVRIKGNLDRNLIERFTRGIKLEDGRARFLSLRILEVNRGKTVMEVEVAEGRDRLIRRMFEKYGILIDRLKRVQIGPVRLAKLATGKFRELSENEVNSLYKLTGLADSELP